MIEFREDTGAMLFYIIEGKRPRSGIVNGIEISKIDAAIRGLIIRNNIHVLYTKDADATGKLLLNYTEQFYKDYEKQLIKLKEDPKITAGSEEISKKKELTLYEKKIKMWRNMPGIGIVNANKLANNVFKDILEGKHEYNATITNIIQKINEGDKETWKKLLMGINGLGKATVDNIISNINLPDILKLSEDELSNIKINGKKIGKKTKDFLDIINS